MEKGKKTATYLRELKRRRIQFAYNAIGIFLILSLVLYFFFFV